VLNGFFFQPHENYKQQFYKSMGATDSVSEGSWESVKRFLRGSRKPFVASMQLLDKRVLGNL
jgi:hypothetical protein